MLSFYRLLRTNERTMRDKNEVVTYRMTKLLFDAVEDVVKLLVTFLYYTSTREQTDTIRFDSIRFDSNTMSRDACVFGTRVSYT